MAKGSVSGPFLLPDMACGHATGANAEAGTSRNGADPAVMGREFVRELDQIALSPETQNNHRKAVIDRVAVEAVQLEQAQQAISMVQKADELYVVRNVAPGVKLGNRGFCFCYECLE